MTLLPHGRAIAAGVEYEVLAAAGTVTAPKFRREAKARLVRYLSDEGQETHAPTFLVAGAVGRLDQVQGLPGDVLDDSKARDLVAGPLALTRSSFMLRTTCAERDARR